MVHDTLQNANVITDPVFLALLQIVPAATLRINTHHRWRISPCLQWAQVHTAGVNALRIVSRVVFPLLVFNQFFFSCWVCTDHRFLVFFFQGARSVVLDCHRWSAGYLPTLHVRTQTTSTCQQQRCLYCRFCLCFSAHTILCSVYGSSTDPIFRKQFYKHWSRKAFTRYTSSFRVRARTSGLAFLHIVKGNECSFYESCS